MHIYTTLTDDNFDLEVLTHPDPVLVIFEAPWSGACQIMTPVLAAVAGEFDGLLSIGRMDIDANTRIPSAYGIRHLPTLLIFHKGEIVDHLTGAVSRNELSDRLSALLQTC